jgi:hypothetical protein
MTHLTTTGVSKEPLASLAHEEYWREAYANEPYVKPGTDYDYYAAGYRTGWEGRAQFPDRPFEDVEDALRAAYEARRAKSQPDWHEGRAAALAAWKRIDDIDVNAR